MMWKNLACRPGMLLMILLTSACATVPASPEEAVAQRVQARADALINKDYKKVYTYFTPAYRSGLTYEQWLGSRPPRADFVSARVVKVECLSEDACDVELESAYRSPMGVRAAPGGVIERVTPQRWVRVDGQWWLYQKQ